MRDTIVYPLVDRGEFLKAFDMIVVQKGVVEQHAKEVADYDADLDVGYTRLGRAMQVLEVALISLVPVAGDAALASGYGLLAVGGTATAAGTGGAAIAEGGREFASGEPLDAGKIAAAGRQGLAIGASAIAPATTKALGGVLGAAEPGVTGLIADTAASGTVGAAQAKLAGGSAGQGFLGSAGGTLVGLGVRGAGVTGPLGSTVGAAGAGAAGTAISGGDWLAGAFGGVGAVRGSVATAAEHLTTEPPGGGGGRDHGGSDDGVPLHVGPEGDAIYQGPTPWMPPPDARHLNVPALIGAVRQPLLALAHDPTKPNSEWLELQVVDRQQMIAEHPEDRTVWERLDDAYAIVRSPKKIENGILKVYLGAAHDGITPAEWLINYFGGPEGMPILDDITPEKFRTAMLEEKPALDNTLEDAPHGLLTHMFQEFLLGEEWGKTAARDFRHAIANMKGPAAGGKEMFSRVWDALFDSLDIDVDPINRPENLGPILHEHLQFPGRPGLP